MDHVTVAVQNKAHRNMRNEQKKKSQIWRDSIPETVV